MFPKMTRDKTILYVEDDVVTLTANSEVLRREGYTVVTASDGLEGLKLLQKSPPDLLLLDLLLPKFTGEDMLKFIETKPSLRQIPVVILSMNSVVNMNNERLVGKTKRQLLKHSCNARQLVQIIEGVLAEAAGETAPAPAVAAAPKLVAAPIVDELQELQNQTQVVCAWTNRVKVDGQWMNVGDFLAKRLHVTVSHGVSPEAMKKIREEIKGHEIANGQPVH
jgi:CheY-like chemotaxis protein